MSQNTRDGEGVYVETGEDVDPGERFSVDQIAGAFGVERGRVVRAMAGEFGLGPEGRVTARQAQDLAEALLGDQPLDVRQAATMQLGAFTPRSDAAWGAGSGPPDEESERQRAEPGTPDDVLASERSSHDPASPPAR
ncbi:MAG: hypothetical protein ACR2OO_14975 [Thermomicrobiales bacterium]